MFKPRQTPRRVGMVEALVAMAFAPTITVGSSRFAHPPAYGSWGPGVPIAGGRPGDLWRYAPYGPLSGGHARLGYLPAAGPTGSHLLASATNAEGPGPSGLANGHADVPQVALDSEERIAEAREIIKEFATTLKGELQAASKSGGPVEAVEVCHVRAPAIARTLAERHGWDVGRTSLKRRNPDNAPDAWETQILQRFDARKAAGEEAATLDHAATVRDSEGARFRYMKAIPTEAVCLACHGGESVAPAVEASIGRYYPDDRARGYQIGDLRGAFTLSHTPERRE